MTDAANHRHAPVPSAARGPALSEDGYVLEEIGDRLYWLADGFYQMMFLVTDDGIVAVDAPPVPTHTFADSTTLEIGGESLQLDYHGPNHSPGNTFIYAPKQQTLMLVDVVFPGWVPFACLAMSQDIPAWMAAPAEADPANPWELFRRYFDGVFDAVEDALVPRWQDRLGGVEVFTDVNAFTMVESLRLDYGRLGPLGIRD